tara:strand:+ start:1907 stop:2713 length:807 start_codon:yes stop_codon:yes gene_type:complete
MEFSIEITLPSGKQCRVNELNNRDYLTIIKFAQNEDYVGLSQMFDNLFIEPDMNIFDRFYLLIYIRMMFIEGSISLTVGDRQVELQLATILDKLEASYVDLETTFEYNGIEVVLDIPCVTFYNSVDDFFISTIKSVKIADKVLTFNMLSSIEQAEVIDNLPAPILDYITKYISTIKSNLLDITLIEANEDVGVERASIDVIGNGVIQFITNIFNTNLESFYSLIYSFQNTILPGSNLFFEISPIESKIILNAHSKRVKEENEKLQKQK